MPRASSTKPSAGLAAPVGPDARPVGVPSDEGGPRYEVRSLARGFELLNHLADRGGEASITELSAASGLPLPTVHRLVRTLLVAGALRQLPSKRYVLGPLIVRLGEAGARTLGATVRPLLGALADATGESANMALLDQGRAVYVAHVSSQRSMRMFTEVGKRVYLHSTGVGKAILAQLPDTEIERLVGRAGLPARTPYTITDLVGLRAAIERVRRDGYVIDDEEEELGVRCVAVPLPYGSSPGAVSVSAPAGRLDAEATAAAIAQLLSTAAALSEGRR